MKMLCERTKWQSDCLFVGNSLVLDLSEGFAQLIMRWKLKTQQETTIQSLYSANLE